MKILGIETSCDETSAAILRVQKSRISLLSNIVSSQINLHKKYGGVYPELASRTHLENIIPAIKASLDKAKTKLSQIDLIAVTTGPGLIGSLLVGVNTAKTLAYSLNKPIIGINHLEGHIYSAIGGEFPNLKLQITKNADIFPAICLIVSGGHTTLLLMKNHGKYQIIGQTKDDAAGEAFDKVAALLGLAYPGGPSIEKIAREAKLKSQKEKVKISLPRPMIDSKDFNFSFSGLKTAVLYRLKEMKEIEGSAEGRFLNCDSNQGSAKGGFLNCDSNQGSAEGRFLYLVKQIGYERLKNVRPMIASEFQQAVIDVLVEKTLRAALKYKVKTVMLSGGVAANFLLRKEMKVKIENSKLKINFLVPSKNLCTDNAAMIAMAAYFRVFMRKQGSRAKARGSYQRTLRATRFSTPTICRGRGSYFKSLKIKPTKWYTIYADANAKLI